MPPIPTATGLAGVKAIFDSTVRPLVGTDGLIAIPDLAALCLLVPSTVAQETYTGLSPAPGLRASIGDLVIMALVAGKLDLVAKLYEAGLGIPRDDFADDRIGLHTSRVRDMAVKATWNPYQVLAAVLEANPAAFDKTALFADARPESVVGDFDNDLGPEFADTAPTVIEFEAGIKAGMTAMKGFHDVVGDPINLAPEFAVIVPTPLEWLARACATNDTLVVSAAAAKTNEIKGQFKPMVLPFLTEDLIAYLAVTNLGAKPVLLQEREPLSTESLGEGTDTWVKQKMAVFSARARRAAAPGHPGLIARLTFKEAEGE